MSGPTIHALAARPQVIRMEALPRAQVLLGPPPPVLPLVVVQGAPMPAGAAAPEGQSPSRTDAPRPALSPAGQADWGRLGTEAVSGVFGTVRDAMQSNSAREMAAAQAAAQVEIARLNAQARTSENQSQITALQAMVAQLAARQQTPPPPPAPAPTGLSTGAKVAIGVGLGAVVLGGGYVVYRAAKKNPYDADAAANPRAPRTTKQWPAWPGKTSVYVYQITAPTADPLCCIMVSDVNDVSVPRAACLAPSSEGGGVLTVYTPMGVPHPALFASVEEATRVAQELERACMTRGLIVARASAPTRLRGLPVRARTHAAATWGEPPALGSVSEPTEENPVIRRGNRRYFVTTTKWKRQQAKKHGKKRR